MMKQCIIQHKNSRMIVWLEADKVKEGIRIKLPDSEDPNIWWTILEVGNTSLEKSEIKDSHNSRKWFKNDYHRRDGKLEPKQ